MKPYDIESVVLGLVLRYGEDAARVVLPQLTPDKFIFRVDGEFGVDHTIIWEAISDVYYHRQPPTLLNVSQHLSNEYATAMLSLVDRLEQQYKVFSLDTKQLLQLSELVDKQGIVYNVASQGSKLYATLDDVERFMQTVSGIQDIDEWMSQRLNEMRSVMSLRSSGYMHISTIADAVKERWGRRLSGEEEVLIECGFPSLASRLLFPRGKLAVIHGQSSSGKSSFVFQINLGAAIQLKKKGIKGCVAINSLEMEQEDLVEKMAAQLAQVDVSKFINKSITKDELDKLTQWIDYAASLPIFIDGTNFMTTTAMEYRASGLHVSEHGPVIQLSSDYGELFADDIGESKEQNIDRVFRNQFLLARTISASVIAISQSTIDRSISGKSYIAGAEGTRYSKAIRMATDIQCELWNPPQLMAANIPVVGPEGFSTAHPWLFIQKYRGAAVGKAIPLGWIPETTSFFDVGVNTGVVQGEEIIFTNLDQGAW